MLQSLLLLYFLASSIVGIASLATITDRITARFNPPDSECRGSVQGADLSQVEADRLTNGRRLALRLPLKPPVRRTLARRTVYNSTHNATLGVFEKREFLGCVSNAYNKFGQYGALTSNPADCLLVSLDDAGHNPQASTISTANAPLAAYPFFGAISGYGTQGSDLGTGIANYAVFGGTVRRSVNSRLMEGRNSFSHQTGIPRAFEHAIFSYRPWSGKIAVHWVNGDDTKPEVHLGHNTVDDALFITGDKASFTEVYGSDSARWVTLHLTPKY